jgi:hypothetical protein
MITLHLTEEELQQYAMEGVLPDSMVAGHLEACQSCQSKLAAYQLMFKSIQAQPAPAFGFDLASLVVAQLPSPKPVRKPNNSLIYLLILLGVILTCIALYQLRFYLAGFLTGIAPLMIYLLLATLIPISIVLGVDMYKSYQKKMHLLDFS